MATAGAKAFHFFGLPRELRDLIYDELLPSSRTISPRASHIHVILRNGARTEYLLVGQQFKAEYNSRVEKWSTLVLEDHISTLDYGLAMSLPLSSTCKVAEVCIGIYCKCVCKDGRSCKAESEVGVHMDWMPRALQGIPTVKTLSTNVYLNRANKDIAPLAMYLAHLYRLTSLPDIRDVSIFYKDFESGTPAKWRYDRTEPVVARWAPGMSTFELLNDSTSQEI